MRDACYRNCLLVGFGKRMGAGTEAVGNVYIALASPAIVNSFFNKRIPWNSYQLDSVVHTHYYKILSFSSF